MDVMIALFALAFISGMMIGGNCSYAMAAPFGAGALSKRRALILYLIFIFLGAVFGGRDVAQNLGRNIIGAVNPALGAVALLSLLLCVLMANILKVPLSTSEMTTGAIAGIGIFFGSLLSGSLLEFYASWILGAILCFLVTYLAARAFKRREPRIPFRKILLIGVGCFFAFSMGANNVGNAIFPLIGTLSMPFALLFGGLALVIGGAAFSGRTMEKMGKGVTEIDEASGLVSSLVAAMTLLIMSLMGLPAPAAHFYTLSTFGIGAANGRDNVSLRAVLEILVIWIVSPLLSIGISYGILALLY